MFEAAFSANLANAAAVPGTTASCFAGSGISDALLFGNSFCLPDALVGTVDQDAFGSLADEPVLGTVTDGAAHP